jgi:hypothetical protein
MPTLVAEQTVHRSALRRTVEDVLLHALFLAFMTSFIVWLLSQGFPTG